MIKNKVHPLKGNKTAEGKQKKEQLFSKNKSRYKSQKPIIEKKILEKCNPDINDRTNSRHKISSKKSTDNTNKKPFDKKEWRLKKYSKKYKLEQWEDKRKKKVLQEYYQQVKNDSDKSYSQKVYNEYFDNDTKTNYVVHPDKLKHEESHKNSNKQRISSFEAAKLELERIKTEKQSKKEDIIRKNEERKEALQLYKKKKTEKYKVLSRKTRKGQPIMKNRIEMLLEQIKSNN